MTRDDLIFAFNHTQSDYLLAAAKSMQTKPLPSSRPRLRYAIIAASFVLLVAMIPIIILLANRTTPPPNPPQPSTHLSITDIPGVRIAGNNDLPAPYIDHDYTGEYIFPQKQEAHDWINSIQEQYSSILGEIRESHSVLLEDTSFLYYITQLTIEIEKTYYNTDEKDSISLIYVHTYEKNGKDSLGKDHYVSKTSYTAIEGYRTHYNMGHYATKRNSGLFLFESAENRRLMIQGESYDLSQYADYYMIAFLDYEKDTNRFGIGRIGSFFRECFENDHTTRQHIES